MKNFHSPLFQTGYKRVAERDMRSQKPLFFFISIEHCQKVSLGYWPSVEIYRNIVGILNEIATQSPDFSYGVKERLELY